MIIVFVLNLFRIAKLGMDGATELHTFRCRQHGRFRWLSVRQEQKVAHEALWHV